MDTIPVSQGGEPYVFVCYSHDDKALVYPEIERLKDSGVDLWYDDGIAPGSEWSDSIAEHIQGCALFLYFVTPRSVITEHCRREVNYALEQPCEMLAVHLVPAELPRGLKLTLSNRQAILKYDTTVEVYEAKLVRAIHDSRHHTLQSPSDSTAPRHRVLDIPAPSSTAPNAVDLRQDIRFCSAPDGVQLAYSVIGQGPPLMKTGNWMTHLEYDLESPIWRHLYRELVKDHTLIRYDARGNGLSDRIVDEISFDAFVSDLETVVDAAGITRFALLGISAGCPVSIAYAVRHPERVSHLILYGGFAAGWNKRARTAAQEEEDAAMLTLMRVGWGKENPAFRQLFTSQFIPDGTKEQADWFNELQRLTVSGDVAARIYEGNGEFDVTAALPRVSVPTLVLHARDDARVPFEAGRRLAAGIPGARFVPLTGRNHLFLETEPAFSQFLEHTRAFLTT